MAVKLYFVPYTNLIKLVRRLHVPPLQKRSIQGKDNNPPAYGGLTIPARVLINLRVILTRTEEARQGKGEIQNALPLEKGEGGTVV